MNLKIIRSLIALQIRTLMAKDGLSMSASLMENEIFDRIQRFQEQLSAHGVDGALIVEKTDLYYLSGTKQDAHLFVSDGDVPLLMVRKDFHRAVSESPLEEILPLTGYSELPHLISKGNNAYPRRMGLEMDVLPAKSYFLYQKLFPKTELVDISQLIREIRMVKSEYEIARIKAAAEMADGMYSKVPEFLAMARTELELSVMVEAYYRKRGHPGIVPTRGLIWMPYTVISCPVKTPPCPVPRWDRQVERAWGLFIPRVREWVK